MDSLLPLISVIIPVYNGENFIAKCLDSVLVQSFKNIEVIITNDGSTDGSLAILNNFSKRDRRIVLIDKPNGGVSSARNIALDNAKGKYIFFIDVDDAINNNCLEALYKTIITSDNTIVMAHTYVHYEGKSVLDDFGYSQNQINMGHIEFISKLLSGKINAFVWGKLFPSFLFNDIRFCEDLSHGEDLFFLANLFQKFHINIVICKDAIYEYNINDYSATATLSEKSIYSNIQKLIKLLSLNLSKSDKENFKKLAYSEHWNLCKTISLTSSIPYFKKIKHIRIINAMFKKNKLCSFWSFKDSNIRPHYHLMALLFSFLSTPIFGIVICKMIYSIYKPQNIGYFNKK